MGRKPSDNPKGTHLGVRVDEAMIQAIDDEIEDIRRDRPGLTVNRSDVVRMWIADAIARRRSAKKTKK